MRFRLKCAILAVPSDIGIEESDDNRVWVCRIWGNNTMQYNTIQCSSNLYFTLTPLILILTQVTIQLTKQQQPIKSKNLSITTNYILSLKKLDNKKLAFVVLTNKKPKMCDDQKRVWGHQSCGWVLSSPSPHCVYLICPSDNYSANFVATNLPHSCRIPSKDISPRSHSSLASFDQLIKQIFAYLGST